MAATIGDVARAAAVSVSTVSYVLSGKRAISAPTRARVERAIRELGYRPNAGARALASKRSHVLAIAVPMHVQDHLDLVMQVVAGTLTQARAHGHDVLLLAQEGIEPIDRATSSSSVDALVVTDVEYADPRIETLARLPQPTVLVGVPHQPLGLSCVDLDFEAAGRLAVDHLASRGHRRLALVTTPEPVVGQVPSSTRRLRRGAAAAASAGGFELTTVPVAPSPSGVADVLEQLFAAAAPPSALVVHHDQALPWIVAWARTRGLAVPADLSILTVSPAFIAARQITPVTSIDIPGDTIGRIAAAMALARVEGERLTEMRLLTPHVVERASVGPGPHAAAASDASSAPASDLVTVTGTGTATAVSSEQTGTRWSTYP